MKLRKKYYDGLQVQDVISQCVDDYGTIMRILKKFSELPTADVVERKKGKWLIEPHEVKGMYNHRCSECLNLLMTSPTDRPKYSYCPNCGAQMDM